MQLEFTLSFTDNLWICHHPLVELYADSLEEMDDNIKEFLKKHFENGEFDVYMYFDFNSFPQWYRQYMPHYFNRKLTFTLSENQILN